MRPKRSTSFQLVWGAFGPLSLLFGGNIVLLNAAQQPPYYRVFDPLEHRYREARKLRPQDRRPRHRRRTMNT